MTVYKSAIILGFALVLFLAGLAGAVERTVLVEMFTSTA